MHTTVLLPLSRHSSRGLRLLRHMASGSKTSRPRMRHPLEQARPTPTRMSTSTADQMEKGAPVSVRRSRHIKRPRCAMRQLSRRENDSGVTTDRWYGNRSKEMRYPELLWSVRFRAAFWFTGAASCKPPCQISACMRNRRFRNFVVCPR